MNLNFITKFFKKKKGNVRIDRKDQRHAILTEAGSDKKKPSHKGVKTTLWAAVAVIFVLAAIFVSVSISKLRGVYLEQCVIDDVEYSVQVICGNKLKPDNIVSKLGLKEGANLANLPLAERRENLLKQLPMVKDIKIVRTLPNKIRVEVTEREPVAQLMMHKSGLVCDDEGVVFRFRPGTSSLPIITMRDCVDRINPGDRLKGQMLAALRVVLACNSKEYNMIKIREADATKPYFVLLTLERDSAQVKFAWEGMEKPSSASDAALASQLADLNTTIAQPYNSGKRLFDATIRHRIQAR